MDMRQKFFNSFNNLSQINLLVDLIDQCKNGVIKKSKLEKMLNEKLRHGDSKI